MKKNELFNQASTPVVPGVIDAHDYEKITPTASTGLDQDKVAKSTFVELQAETQDVRIHLTTTCTTTTGFVMSKGNIYTLSGNLTTVQFLESAAGGIIHAFYY